MNPLESQLQHHDAGISIIFTRENLPAILAVMNSQLPRDESRVAETEFQTVVRAAHYEGALHMINAIIKFTAARNSLHG